MSDAPTYDVAIVGGGPTGATAAILLARAGLRTAVIEKDAFPRFQIGESFLVETYELLRRLDLLGRLAEIPHLDKLGAELAFGNAEETSMRFRFDQALTPGENRTFNVARADFDALLLDEARVSGADVLQPAAVRKILRLDDGRVELDLGESRLDARVLFDASGQATLVGRHLGTRRVLREPHLRKVAYFQHFEGVERLDGEREGYPTIVMAEEGWFWIIPLNACVTSVGMVVEPGVVKRAGVPADRMLAWGVARCPLVRRRMRAAAGPEQNRVRADFSYRCEPFAGPGYFLLGDAATFLDPVFSSGVCMGMRSAVAAAETAIELLAGRLAPERARRRYARRIEVPTREFFRIIRHFYDHSFRELFLNGSGPLGVHRAVLDVLAGHVYPRASFAARWRLRLLEAFIVAQRHLPLVPRRPRFSLFDADPAPAAATMTAAATAADRP